MDTPWQTANALICAITAARTLAQFAGQAELKQLLDQAWSMALDHQISIDERNRIRAMEGESVG